jgi:hypothetical protein
MAKANEAIEKVKKNKVRYRAVLGELESWQVKLNRARGGRAPSTF